MNETLGPGAEKRTPGLSGSTVLVTGGSGFIGSWVVIELLKRGFKVRTTVRSLATEGRVRDAIRTQVHADDRLSFFTADLLRDDGWQTAVDGSDFVVHVASPMPVGEYRKTDVIRPAREGTKRVLEAALRGGVRRVVMTSSTAAASLPENSKPGPLDETVWTDTTSPQLQDYSKAKTLAERDAWAFMDRHGGAMTLSTVLPGMVQGPVLGPDYSGSVELLTRMLAGRMPFFPRIGFSTVDVRDLADLHVRALISDKAGGQRFIGTSDFIWLADIARLLKTTFGAKASKVPQRAFPDIAVRWLAHLSADMRFIAPMLNKRNDYSHQKAASLLGWQPRPAANAIVDTAESLIARGLV